MIELAGISRSFKVGEHELYALQGIDLSIAAGEYMAVMGPSASGKSTLLNIVGLLDRPSSGRYWLDGEEVSALDDEARAQRRRDKIGFVFQSFHLIERLTAAENVELPLVLSGRGIAVRRRQVAAVLAALGIEDRAHHRPHQLSGGQRQRVAIARALVGEPALILADEPTGNLDRRAGGEVVELLEQLNGRGLTLIVVTHDPDIGRRARRCLRLVDGEIAVDRRQGHGVA
ncbi:MAG: ABC transporter ATP-binding protein [Candidatus Competibacterales bacterium]